ncbi:rIIB lysis inhibitor [Ruegeria phage RpAliso]|nr:rIIB lysis inhibitor [Ruegeria phage RpAliso]
MREQKDLFMRFPFTASEETISIFFGGKMHTIPKTDRAFEQLYEHLKEAAHDYALVETLIDKPAIIERLAFGNVKVVGSKVLYKDTPIHTTLAEKLLSMVDAGFDASNWARFLDRVMENPSERSRSCLYDFIATWNAPITEDGHFIAFKKVRHDYLDLHSGTMDNSPGQIVEMPRDRVNADPDVKCTYGLHVAATSYLGSFGWGGGNRVIAVKVDPADVVAVPRDYNFAKMRVCRYLVIGDAEESFVNNAHKVEVSYVGTEEATGEIDDLEGKPICYNATDFAANWKRDLATGVIHDGDLVVASVLSTAEGLPENRFGVGRVVAVHASGSTNAGSAVVDVIWQDETTAEGLIFNAKTATDTDVVVVIYIGEDEDEEEPTRCPDCEELMPNWKFKCEDCEERDERNEEEWQATVDAVDEEDHILETGCTSAGEPVDMTGFNAFYGDQRTEIERRADEEAEASRKSVEQVFERNGKTYTASFVRDGVQKHGQRGFSRATGIPRTTLQDWMSRM